MKNIKIEKLLYVKTKAVHLFYDIKWYFKNLFMFQKIIKAWRPWDYSYQVQLFTFGIEQLCKSIEKYGNEENISRGKKVSAMKKLIKQLNRDVETEAYSQSYEITNLSNKEKYEKYNAIINKLRDEKYNTIFKLIRGQKHSEFDRKMKAEIEKIKQDNSLSEEEKTKLTKEGNYEIFQKIFDGSGIEGWWE